jgi:hypothetical protein
VAIEFDRVNRFVLITAPQTTVTTQAIYDACKDYEDEPGNLDLAQLCEAFGKQDLGGGVLVAITLVMLNGWRVKFEDRAGPVYEQMRISGGNIVANYTGSPDYNQNPVAPSSFTQVFIAASSSGTLLQQEEVATKVDEVHKLHGLDTANPLVVDNANDRRVVGTGSPEEIVQDVTTVGDVTTVTRVK